MTTAPRLRIAAIGCGWLATDYHITGIARLPELELVALCDIDAARLKLIADRFHVRQTFADYREMLDRVQPDGVCLVGPPALHVEAGCELLRRQIPFMMEKPPATTLAGARELARAATKYGDCGMVGYTSRACPAVRVAWQISRRPEFGPVSYVATTHLTQAPIHPCWDIADRVHAFVHLHGVHAIDLWRYFGGDPAEVSASVTSLRPTADERYWTGSVLAHARRGDATHGTIHMKSGASHNGDINADVMGTNTRVRVEDDQTLNYEHGNETLRELMRDDPLASAILAESPVALTMNAGLIANSYYPDYFRFEWQMFAANVLARRPLSPSILDAYRTACLTEAICASLSAGGAMQTVDYDVKS
jgi:myo-inositol 2-dehydrogenase/D-chiro-inositol 1-dehydrogenase